MAADETVEVRNAPQGAVSLSRSETAPPFSASEDDLDEGLEDAALELYLKTGSHRQMATLLRRPLTTAWRMCNRARERRRVELLSTSPGDLVSDILSNYRLVRAEAMGQYILAPPASYRRANFLNLFLQAARDEERLLASAGGIPQMPARVEVGFVRATQESRATFMQEIEQLPPDARNQARRQLYAALLAVKDADQTPGAGAPSIPRPSG